MITVKADGKDIPVNYHKFSDGAITFKLDQLPEDPKEIEISVDPRTEVRHVREELTLIIDCLELSHLMTAECALSCPVKLVMPYMPYGRADRVFEAGNGEPLVDFLAWIDKLSAISIVETCDPHNVEAVSDHLNSTRSVEIISQLHCLGSALDRQATSTTSVWDVVLAPDKGAIDKAQTIADYYNIPCVPASKTRDKTTGKILSLDLPEYDFTDKKVLIPDDIWDGGGTFIGLAHLLREEGSSQVEVYVTHLIASRGLDGVRRHIDRLYYYQIVGEHITEDRVKSFNSWRIGVLK